MQRSPLKTIAAILAALFLLNLYIVHGLASLEYLNQMGSIEAVHIAFARYWQRHGSENAWFPLWYSGFPISYVYQPALPLASAMLSQVTAWTPAHAYHWVIAVMYALGPVSLCWMAWVMSGRPWASAATGLFYSLLSPSGLLMQTVRVDMGGWRHARRYQALVRYGEGPHVISLTLVTFALGAMHLACTRRTAWSYVLAGTGMGLLLLTSWPGTVALTMFSACYLLTAKRPVWLLAVIAAVAYLAIAPWNPLSEVLQTYQNANRMAHGPVKDHGYYISWALLPSAAALVWWGTRRVNLALRLGLFYTLLTSWIVLGSEYFHVFILPDAGRFHLEMEIGLVLAAAFALAALSDRLPGNWRGVIVAVVVVFFVRQTITYRRYVRASIQPIDITSTVEYRVSKYLEQHYPGQRVMAGGSTAFWMNVFTDSPQVTGCCDQSVLDDLIWDSNFNIKSGMNDPQARARVVWLKVYGAQAVYIDEPGTRDSFVDFYDTAPLRAQLTEVWREGVDTIYRVPQRTASLAHVMTRQDLTAHRPVSGIDYQPMLAYVAALDNPALPAADWQWETPSRAHITTRLEPGQIVSVQENAHFGWHASVAGQPVPIEKDALGYMVIDPKRSGAMKIDLVWDGGVEARILWWLRLAALLTVAAVLYRGWREARA